MRLALRTLPFLALLILLAACGTATPLHVPVPEAQISQARVPGFGANIRSWSDEAPEHLESAIAKRIREYTAAHTAYFATNQRYPAMEYLALSGGAEDGAFGAGLLNGWSETGTRPAFTVVTGVSTGALIAPFAFLGPEYDAALKEVYTTLAPENIFEGTIGTVLDGLTGGLALADNGPLARKIEEMTSQAMLERIGEEHRKGRRLLIATTNLEAQRGVIWDIGAIANTENPEGLKLFRSILLASAAVPGVVKPVYIDVAVDGKRYNEIHVDGGVTAQVFLFPLQSTRRESALFQDAGIPRALYIIRNTRIQPEYKAMIPGLLSLSKRSVETLIKNQGVGDLYRLYVGAKRDGIAYNLAYVPPEFAPTPKTLFDPDYMQQLFAFGYAAGKSGIRWQHAPPGVEFVDR